MEDVPASARSSAAPRGAQLPAKAVVAQQVDSLIRSFMADRGPASVSVAIVRAGDTLVRRSWGLADAAANRSASEGMTYRIGSVSKQFTAALILKLVDSGRLSLSDSIGTHLTGLRPEWGKITVEQLLNHTSGMHREYRQPNRRLENLPGDTLLAMATRDTMIFAPGTSFAYSNTGYMILGVLLEKLHGKSYSQILRDEIAHPLRLTTLGWCNDPEKAATETLGHQRNREGELERAIEINPGLALGAGGICSSAGDLSTWNLALHGGRVLSPASYAAMITPRGAAREEDYGFGIRVQQAPGGGTAFGHAGATPGFAAENAWFPEDALSVTILYNSSPSRTAGGLLDSVSRIASGRSAVAAQ